MREAQVAASNDIRRQCGSGPESGPAFGSRVGRIRAFALPGLAAVADRLRQVPRRGSTSAAGPARLLDNGSTPVSRRQPEPLLPGAGETPQPDRNRARRPARARRVGGALLPALAAIIAVSLSVQGHAQTSVPHDWGLKPGGLGTGDEFRLLFVSSTLRNGTSSTIGDYDTHVQTAAANGHADIQGYSALFKAVGCTSTTNARDHTGTRYTATDTGVVIRWLGGAKVADDYEDFYDGDWDSSLPRSQTGASISTTLANGVITGCNDNGTKSGSELGDTGNVTQSDPSNNTGLAGNTTSPNNSRKVYGLSPVFRVAAPPPDPTVVPETWSLKPSGLSLGDEFRLLFLSSTKRDGSSTDIATYNTFVQTRAAAGHTDIQAYSDGFTVVGCTEDVDARDNTYTIGTGVPIHWLNGNKVADDYADFYDEDWDEEGHNQNKNELGENGPNTNNSGNYPLTGCDHDGTEDFSPGGTALALGTDDVTGGRPNSSTSGHSPLSGAILDPTTNRPMYGLSAVFEVGTASSTDATLSALVVNDGTNDLTLTPTFASSTDMYTAAVGNATTTVTLTVTVNDAGARVTGVTLGGTAVSDDEFIDGITIPSLVEGDNVIVVTVTAEDASTQDYTVTVSRARRTTTTPTLPAEVEVANDWSLIPSGLVAGDKFRLLFLSSTKTDGTSYDIADYNTFVQGRAAAGHTDIRAYSGGFRSVGCTADSDARDNTGTTGTGVVIHWLDGTKVADDNADFYNENWDNEANDKNELGNNGPNTSQSANYPLTGCKHIGTEAFSGSTSEALGAPGGSVRVGRPNSSGSGHGPIGSNQTTADTNNRPMYGLSQVFEVAAAVVTNTDPVFMDGASTSRDFDETIGNAAVATASNIGTAVTATDTDLRRGAWPFPNLPPLIGPRVDTLTYSIAGADAGKFGLITTNGQIRTKVGEKYDHEADSSYSVTLTVTDGNGGTDSIAVTLNVEDRDEPPLAPNAPTVTATSGSATSLDVSWMVPTNTGRPTISNYDLQYQKTTESTWTNGPQNATSTSAAIGSLDAGTAYRVQVRATNPEGDGPWSGSGSGTTGTAVTPGVTVSESSLTVTEEDSTGDSYTVVLDSQPTANVVVTVAGHAGTEVTPAPTLTFTTVNWETAQEVTVTAGTDADTTDDTVTLTHSAASTDSDYGGIAIAEVAVTVEDNDTAQVTGVRAVPEGTMLLTVRWTRVSNATGYQIQWKSGGQNYSSSRQAPVSSGSDTDRSLIGLANGTEYTIRMRAVRSGANNGPWSDDAMGTPRAPGVTVSESSLTVTEEDAAGDSYTVVLKTRPTASVTVTVAGHAGTEVLPSPATLTFTRANWETAQTVNVTANNDADTTDDTVTLTHSAASTDSDYDGIAIAEVAVTVEDNDTAQVTGVTVDSGNAQLVVGWDAVGNATGYRVQWKSGGQSYNTSRQAIIASGSTTSHTISSLANGTEYTMRVKAVRTGASDGPWSEDATGTPEVPTAPGVTLSKTALTVTEEDATGDSYTVVLDTLPTANVVVTVAGHAGTGVTLDTTTLTFTTVNWETAQEVTVTASDDADTAGETVTLTHSAASTDSDYGGIAIANVTVTVEDNDTAQVMGVTVDSGNAQLVVGWDAVGNATGYRVQWKSGGQGYNNSRQATIASGSTTSHTIPSLANGTEYTMRVRAVRTGANEGPWSDNATGTPEVPTAPGVTLSKTSLTVTEEDATGDSYTVVLDTLPTANVVVTVAGHAGTDVTPAPTPLTFTTVNWETAQEVTVTAADDADATDDTVTLTHSAASTDSDYGGIAIADVTVTVEDNDTAQVTGVTVDSGNAQLVVGWDAVGNATGYRVQWKSGGQGYNNSRQATIASGSTRNHTISSLANGTEYTLRVRAVRTGANEGPWSDNATGTPEVPVAPGVTLSKTALTVIEEDATGDSYTVVLDTLPTAGVVVTVAGHSGTDVTATSTPLTFTTVNWETAQTVTVTAGNDADTADETVTLTHSAASTDSDYGGIAIADVTVTVEDNDTSTATSTATSTPTISGPAQVGMTLTAGTDDIMDADGLTSVSYAYRWRKAGSDIDTATSSAYTLTPSDYGEKIRVRVDFTDDAGNPESLLSDETLPVAPAAATCPTDDATVWCATLTVGHRLEEALPGDFYVESAGFEARSGRDPYGSVAPATFSHLGVDYTVTSVFGSGNDDAAFATTPNLPVDGAGLTLHVQTYGGEIDVALSGTFVEAPGVWYLENMSLTNPTDALSVVPLIRGQQVRYGRVLEPTDLDTEVTVRLSYANRPATSTPTITGTAQVGATLTADPSGITDADGLSGASYTYRWIRVDGGTETPISGATSDTYVPVAADVGRQVKVEVTFADDGDNTETLESDPYPSGGTIIAAVVGSVSVKFASSTYSATEGGSVTVRVQLSDTPASPVTIPLTRTNLGGATNADYSGFPPAGLTFGTSDTSQTFTLLATDDSVDDDDESVEIGFGTLPSGVVEGSPATATVSLVDNDAAPPTVRFGAPSYTATEGGADATVTVELSEAVGSSTTIPLTPTNRGGATDADYTGVPLNVTFGAAQTSTTFTVTAVDDSDNDRGESVRIGFGTAAAGCGSRQSRDRDRGAGGQRRLATADGVVRVVDVHGDGGRRRGDGDGRGGPGGSAVHVAPDARRAGRRDERRLLGRAVQRRVPRIGYGEELHGDGGGRQGGRRRRERGHRLRRPAAGWSEPEDRQSVRGDGATRRQRRAVGVGRAAPGGRRRIVRSAAGVPRRPVGSGVRRDLRPRGGAGGVPAARLRGRRGGLRRRRLGRSAVLAERRAVRRHRVAAGGLRASGSAGALLRVVRHRRRGVLGDAAVGDGRACLGRAADARLRCRAGRRLGAVGRRLRGARRSAGECGGGAGDGGDGGRRHGRAGAGAPGAAARDGAPELPGGAHAPGAGRLGRARGTACGHGRAQRDAAAVHGRGRCSRFIGRNRRAGGAPAFGGPVAVAGRRGRLGAARAAGPVVAGGRGPLGAGGTDGAAGAEPRGQRGRGRRPAVGADGPACAGPVVERDRGPGSACRTDGPRTPGPLGQPYRGRLGAVGTDGPGGAAAGRQPHRRRAAAVVASGAGAPGAVGQPD